MLTVPHTPVDPSRMRFISNTMLGLVYGYRLRMSEKEGPINFVFRVWQLKQLEPLMAVRPAGSLFMDGFENAAAFAASATYFTSRYTSLEVISWYSDSPSSGSETVIV